MATDLEGSQGEGDEDDLFAWSSDAVFENGEMFPQSLIAFSEPREKDTPERYKEELHDRQS
jgi:hypothetical protein